MHIYVDETGGFVAPPVQKNSYSLVSAVIVPSAIEKELFYQFLRLRDTWPNQAVEIKGSSLNEAQAAQIINPLAEFDVTAEFVALDMGSHPQKIVDDFKSRQAEAIIAHVTREHQPEMVHHLALLSRIIHEMPNQLFIQAELTIRLVLKVIRTATLYYVQRQPQELGDIAWIVDRKNRTVTEMEETWTTLILGMGESHFMREPLIWLKEGDYSHFARYETDPTVDEEMARHLDWVATAYGVREELHDGRVVDLKQILTEQHEFGNSRDSLGLQLADILASILRRALNSHLQPPGWKDIGKLVVRSPNPGWFIQLGPGNGNPLQGSALDVYRALEDASKPMLYKGFVPK